MEGRRILWQEDGGAFCRYHQPDDKGGPRHNIKRINEPLSPALSPLVPRGERESLRARFGGTDEMRPLEDRRLWRRNRQPKGRALRRHKPTALGSVCFRRGAKAPGSGPKESPRTTEEPPRCVQ